MTPTDTHTYPMRGIEITEIAVPKLPVGGQYKPDLGERRLAAQRLRDAGATYEEIAYQMGVSRQTVWNWVNISETQLA